MKLFGDTVIVWIHKRFCNCFSINSIDDCFSFRQARRAMHLRKMCLINIILSDFLKHCIYVILIVMLFSPLRVVFVKAINGWNFKRWFFLQKMMPRPYKSVEFLARVTKSSDFHGFLRNSGIFSDFSTRAVYVPFNAMFGRVNCFPFNSSADS